MTNTHNQPEWEKEIERILLDPTLNGRRDTIKPILTLIRATLKATLRKKYGIEQEKER